MGWANGELEIKVNGQRVYSYKEEHSLPGDAALLQRINSQLTS
jgi:predicted Rdx family selenoprotein